MALEWEGGGDRQIMRGMKGEMSGKKQERKDKQSKEVNFRARKKGCGWKKENTERLIHLGKGKLTQETITEGKKKVILTVRKTKRQKKKKVMQKVK